MGGRGGRIKEGYPQNDRQPPLWEWTPLPTTGEITNPGPFQRALKTNPRSGGSQEDRPLRHLLPEQEAALRSGKFISV